MSKWEKNEVAIEEGQKKLANDDVVVEEFGKELWYLTKERQPLGEWWKNHILPQHGEGHANMAIIEGPLSWSATIRQNIKKLMGNVKISLYMAKKLRNSLVVHIFDYLQIEQCWKCSKRLFVVLKMSY